jgi:hypothetical protein
MDDAKVEATLATEDGGPDGQDGADKAEAKTIEAACSTTLPVVTDY